ncbi:MAG: Spo0B domain-containing protein, partial [Oscillospiraceae bacterium]|nr:Spo0B domain-containing protein [Oscillospiraceae bacterium]
MKKRFELRKALSLMTAVSITVLVGAAASAVYLFLTGVSPAEAAALVALLIISVAALVVFLLLRRHFGRLSAEVSQAEDSISALAELNSTLRAQRHDFLNHLQVVYTLVDLKKYDDANAYIEKVYGDIQKVGSVMRTSIPSVNAILHAKQMMCASRGIDVECDVRTTLAELPMEDWEFCRVLGNIIDNSIHAL